MSVTAQSEVFTLTYRLPAACELVLRAFTRAGHLRRWWGPAGFTIAVRRFDRLPGGVFHYSMEAPLSHPLGDKRVWGRFVYREIDLPKRIVLLGAYSDERGGLARHPMRSTWPMQICSDFNFVEQNGHTSVTLRATPYEATELERDAFAAGRALMQTDATESFAQLEGYLAKLAGNRSVGVDLPEAPGFTSSSAPEEQIQFV